MKDMHAAEGELQQYMHGELGSGNAGRLRLHLQECEECSRLLAEAEREERIVFDMLRQVDHTPPDMELAALLSPRQRPRFLMRAAAILAGIVIAGAAYAIPGSPLRDLLRMMNRGGAPKAPPSRVEGGAVTDLANMSGQQFSPAHSFVINFSAHEAASTVIVSMIDGDRITVRFRPTGAATLNNPDSTSLMIAVKGGPAEYHIDVPRSAPRVAIRVGASTLFEKLPTGVTAGVAGDSGRYVLSLAPPP